MNRTIVLPPASGAPAVAPILDAPTARARLSIDDASQDATIAAYLAAATALIDGPNGWLGRAILPQTLQLQADSFPPWCGGFAGADVSALPTYGFRLLCPPIVDVVSVSYIDQNGSAQTLDPSAYELAGRDLMPAYATAWPSPQLRPGAVKVTYDAGYAAGEVPAPIVQAILLQVSAMLSMMRGQLLSSETVVGVYSRSWATGAADANDRAAQALLAPYRVIDA